jgi:hypothetical protein
MAIVRLDKVNAAYSGNLESLKFGADATNGLFVHVGNLVTGERELHDVVAPSATTFEKQEVVLHASPEVMYDERKYKLADFVLDAGVAGRGYHLTEGDVVTLTSDLFTAAPTVGQFVVPDDASSMKLKPSADGTVTVGTTVYNPKFQAKVIEQTTLDGATAYAIKVLKV